MLSSKSLIACLLLLFFLSCNQKEVSVCDGNDLRCTKYTEVFRSVGLSFSLSGQGTSASIKVSPKDQEYAFELIEAINQASKSESQPEIPNFAQVFVPIIKTKLSLLKDALVPLEQTTGVFSVKCSNSKVKEQNDSLPGFACSIWYLSSLISESQIKVELSELPQSSEIVFSYLDLLDILKAIKSKPRSMPELASKMIVLDPFSFHVPYVEKDVAGIQLILVLGVFLMSGFVLGFWVGSREKRI